MNIVRSFHCSHICKILGEIYEQIMDCLWANFLLFLPSNMNNQEVEQA